MQYAEYYVQFFTATILEWKQLLKQDQYKDIIVESLGYLVKEQRVKVYAFVIMNNHLHVTCLTAVRCSRCSLAINGSRCNGIF
jgi:REP element-mobilizing transposase RayT